MTEISRDDPLLFFGCGNMGRAMLEGWIAGGADPAGFIVVDPVAQSLPAGVVHYSGAAQLEEHRELQSPRLRQCAEPERRGGIERQRLFRQHMPAGLERPRHIGRQQMMRQPDIDGLNRRVGQQIVEIGRAAGAGPLGKILRPRRIGVIGRDETHRRQQRGGAGDLAGGPAAADDSDADHGRNPGSSGAPTRCDSEP